MENNYILQIFTVFIIFTITAVSICTYAYYTNQMSFDRSLEFFGILMCLNVFFSILLGTDDGTN